MNDLTDPIERLRAERPDRSTDPRLGTSERTRAERAASAPVELRSRARRPARHVRVGIAACIAVALVLTGAVSIRGAGERHRGFDPGISVAEARERAIDALTSLGDLEAYEYRNAWSVESTDGRVYESSRTMAFDGRNSHLTRWSRDDFRGVPRRDGIPELVVDDYVYEGRGRSNAIDEPWLLDVKDGWRAPEDRSRPMSSSVFMMRPLPDFATLVEQLEREGLVDARRDEGGNVVIEIDRPAGDLAPVTASMQANDPIAEFAMGIKHMRSPAEIVHVRMTIGDDGDLRRVAVSARTRTLVANGRRGGETIEGVSRAAHELVPLDEEIVAPDPRDVMVVGNVLKSRRGETGIAGPLGTLDELTVEELRRLRRTARRAPNAAYDSWGIKRPRSPRSYPAVWKHNRAQVDAARAAVRALRPFDRAALASRDGCVPLWPDSRREMDRARAIADPAAAGWKCSLGEELGAMVVMPGARFVELEVRIGRNGLGHSQYRPPASS